MSERSDEAHHSASKLPEQQTDPNGLTAAAEALKRGPRGAFFLAGIAVALLLLGWLAFYFLLFLPRGSIG